MPANLQQLINRTKELGVDNGSAGLATKLANNMPLSHATSVKKFSSICAQERLYSQNNLINKGFIPAPQEETHEQMLGTDNAVFFALAPFCYPSTDCGILLKYTLEEKDKDKSSATPFDSGGLLTVFTITDTGETPRSFFEKHLLPVPQHRELLCSSMNFLFSDPLDYLDGKEPVHQGPVALSGGDRRRWTHEVRIDSEVSIVDEHLEAVFMVKNRAVDSNIEAYLSTIRKSVPIVQFAAPRAGEFNRMQQECINYIQNKIGV